MDGDRGGDLIIRGLIDTGVEIDYVIKAPDGKEVEELTKKEVHKALRSKVAIEQIKMEISKSLSKLDNQSRVSRFTPRKIEPNRQPGVRPPVNRVAPTSIPRQNKLSPTESKKFKELLDDLVGTRAAYLLDNSLNILGKVPVSELITTMKNIKAYAIVFDGVIDRNINSGAERSNIKYLVAMSSRLNPRETRINILTQRDLS